MIDVVASRVNFLDHLLPVWNALPDDMRGTLYTTSALIEQYGLDAKVIPAWPKFQQYVLVAAQGDAKTAAGRRVIRMEHGVGFSFGGEDPAVPSAKRNTPERAHSSYAGGRGQKGMYAFLNPNHWANDRWANAYPGKPCHIIGTPKLDTYVNNPDFRRSRVTGAKPVVCLSFHWDARVCPETRSALPHYRKALRKLTSDGRTSSRSSCTATRAWPPTWRSWPTRSASSGSDLRRGAPPRGRLRERRQLHDVRGGRLRAEGPGAQRSVVSPPGPARSALLERPPRLAVRRARGPGTEAARDHLRHRAGKCLRAAAVASAYPYLGSATARAIEILKELVDEEPVHHDRGTGLVSTPRPR